MTPIKAGWNESDLGALQIYLEHVYGLYTPSKLKGILLAIAAERGYHPIRDYIESLPAWDGVPRVDTLLKLLVPLGYTLKIVPLEGSERL